MKRVIDLYKPIFKNIYIPAIVIKKNTHNGLIVKSFGESSLNLNTWAK